MSENNQVYFKISAALKNLIGKELITDQYIAIFELVKNAFDAQATEVEIKFENIYDKKKAKLTISDNGKGMDFLDIENKWLFVAYSAKKDGTEDYINEVQNTSKRDDYRDKIKPKRVFAGAKGVGRFSCDRLGSKLNMITRKNKKGSAIENIQVSWDDFENDSKAEFINVPVIHRVLDVNTHSIANGTILEVEDLRDEWYRDNIIKLKKSLEKLVNPNQDNDNDNFSIIIKAEEEALNDKLVSDQREKVNGKVENTIFEKFNLKTTHIVSEIDEGGNIITTTLTDRGKLIYKIRERNPFPLQSIKVHLFYLNRIAKRDFTMFMGIESVKYGSIFMYKNGFRVYPYGEPGEDFLGIDQRKAQGYNRFLGTRDLIGRIEIYGINDNLTESTSRDGGLIKSKEYYQLEKFFKEKVLRRLEKYTVDIIRWGDPLLDKDGNTERPEINPEDVKDEIVKIIENLTKASEIINVEYDKNFLNIIDKAQEKSVTNILKSLSKQAEKANDIGMQKEVQKAQKRFVELLETVKTQDKALEKKNIEVQKVNDQLNNKDSQVLLLRAITSHQVSDLVNLFHQTGISSNTIDNIIKYFNRKLSQGTIFTNEEIIDTMQKISFENKKIQQLSNFVTKANIVLESQETKTDLIGFIIQYVEKYKQFISNGNLAISIKSNSGDVFIKSFKPIEVTIMIDNFINNSKKANSRNFDILINKISERTLQIIFKDDGNGLDKSIQISEDIFQMGYTTTSGSGIGLYHIRDILKELNGTVSVNTNVETGIEFIVEVKL